MSIGDKSWDVIMGENKFPWFIVNRSNSLIRYSAIVGHKYILMSCSMRSAYLMWDKVPGIDLE